LTCCKDEAGGVTRDELLEEERRAEHDEQQRDRAGDAPDGYAPHDVSPSGLDGSGGRYWAGLRDGSTQVATPRSVQATLLAVE